MLRGSRMDKVWIDVIREDLIFWSFSMVELRYLCVLLFASIRGTVLRIAVEMPEFILRISLSISTVERFLLSGGDSR